jgi:hypothetical protein
MQATRSKLEMLVQLRTLLANVFRLRNQGGVHAKLSYAQGYADGYMRCIAEAGLVTQRELLAIVAQQREASDGPATREVIAETTQTVQAA